MGKPHAAALVILGIIIAAIWLVFGGGPSGPDESPLASDESDARTGVVGGPVAPADSLADADGRIRDDVVYSEEDVRIFDETMEWAADQGLDTMGIGDAMVRLGRRFVGDTYTPHLLDPPGPERLVVNLREFDCVTYVESVLAMARVLRAGDPEFAAFTEELRRIRYRGGNMEDYVSRLHYFSEWIHDNEEMDLVRNITADLGGIPDLEAIDFMTSNVDAYAKLEGQPERVERIREAEERLSERPRHYIPQDRIGDIASDIQDGDIIAATSSVEGLDIAHTGLAVWVDGRLHLMHAPLVGSSVEISVRPLAARILRIDGQDGIMVARPL